jgi:F-type H+-transporting ATPase subunit epsilon
MSLYVRVITLDKVIWDAPADELILPSLTGKIGILTDHAPLITALDIGVMRFKCGSNWKSSVVLGGVAVIEYNEVTILSTAAEEGSNIDLKAAQEDLERVTLLVSKVKTKKEKIEATLELRKAQARLQTVS